MSAGRVRDWPTSNRSWTAVDTLLTFWPPGPEARTKVTVSSESGMNIGKVYFQNSRDDHTGTRAHFLKILSRAFPFASSSTSLSR